MKLRNLQYHLSKTQNRKLELVGSITKAPDHANGFKINNRLERGRWSKEEGWVYFIVSSGLILRIGSTDNSLSSSLRQYESGELSEEIVETFHRILNRNRRIVIYGYRVPRRLLTEEVFGETISYATGVSKSWKRFFLDICREQTGGIPILNKIKDKVVIVDNPRTSNRGTIKYGYQRIDEEIVPFYEEQSVLNTIKTFRRKGVSFNEIATRLNKKRCKNSP